MGKCSGCEAWNTLVEENTSSSASGSEKQTEGSLSALRDEFKTSRDRDFESVGMHGAAIPGGRSEIVSLDAPEAAPTGAGFMRRISTGMVELDRVLGGGLVPDSFTLLGGDPGIGKSTLLIQTARGLAESTRGTKEPLRILYVSGEESVDQIRGRARRLGIKGENQIFLMAETQLERVFASVKELKPDVLIIDSLQTFSSSFLESAPGSVSQVREVAARLMTLAKTAGIAVMLIGHVTKEGNIAGPKVVEHIVDTVLYFEGDGSQTYRLLRTVKNRFGSSRELGVFEMQGEWLAEVTNPSALFLSERSESAAGTAVAASIEGSRPILVELQALVSPSSLAMPRRTAVGIDSARIALIAAILERHVQLPLAQKDLFFNVSGGLKLSEPACDLAAAVAIWSSAKSVPVAQDWIMIGELGLTGEVRRVPQIETRLDEAKKLGFKAAVMPKSLMERVTRFEGLKLIPIARASELAKLLS